mgnify:CR=1 FL=1
MKIMNNVNVTAKYMNARVSPKKVAIVLDMIRGKDLEEAKKILAFDRSKPGKLVLKVLKSAEANVLNNKKMEKDKLFVSKISVDGGRTLKRLQTAPQGLSLIHISEPTRPY